MGGVGSIPFTAIIDYGRFYGLRDRSLDDFVWIIMRVDRHYTNVIVPMVRARDTPSS